MEEQNQRNYQHHYKYHQSYGIKKGNFRASNIDEKAQFWWDEIVLESIVKLQMELIQDERDASFNTIMEVGVEVKTIYFHRKVKERAKHQKKLRKQLNPNYSKSNREMTKRF
ncbi:hypothetical protein OXYTRIMIC_267 [Oxytricha trifallax]|uniref:Uncharacterized protein n=1 Tax=Oxytricha trifallax TaxID=1172189 RepID=A0A073IAP0_9SPIT|nr:hypothetical protein OXYTRIMIC_267 [Oxytricha trifallax]